MTVNINKEWKRDLIAVVFVSVAILGALVAARLVPTNVVVTEWTESSVKLPPLEETVIGLYLVEMPDGTVKRWELNVVRFVSSFEGELQEMWLLDRPEAGQNLGRPARWKPVDVTDYPDKQISYKEIQLFLFPNQESLWTY